MFLKTAVFAVLILSLAACALIEGVKKPVAMRSLDEITSSVRDRYSKLDTIRRMGENQMGPGRGEAIRG